MEKGEPLPHWLSTTTAGFVYLFVIGLYGALFSNVDITSMTLEVKDYLGLSALAVGLSYFLGNVAHMTMSAITEGLSNSGAFLGKLLTPLRWLGGTLKGAKLGSELNDLNRQVDFLRRCNDRVYGELVGLYSGVLLSRALMVSGFAVLILAVIRATQAATCLNLTFVVATVFCFILLRFLHSATHAKFLKFRKAASEALL